MKRPRSGFQRSLPLTRFLDANRFPLRSKTPCLLRRLLQRRDARQDDLDARAAPRRGIEIEPAAEAVGDDAVDDVQAKPGTALTSAHSKGAVQCTPQHHDLLTNVDQSGTATQAFRPKTSTYLYSRAAVTSKSSSS